MSIGKHSRFGFQVRRMPDATDKMWLHFVFWYPRSAKLQGYKYAALRWL
jgi:hypothetical protein